MPQLLSTGRSYHYEDLHPSKEPRATLLCIHGFPDLAYGWRHQTSAWVEQGYRVIAPDMLGYGKTDMPSELSAYSPKLICDDLAALLDHLDVNKAVIIGHDWGSILASMFARWHTKRVLALTLLSIPYIPPRNQYLSLEDRVKYFPCLGYQFYLSSEQSTAEIEAHLPLFFRLLYRSFAQTPVPLFRKGELQDHLLSGKDSPDGCILKDDELAFYMSNFERGMVGPLNYYRINDLLFEEEKDVHPKLSADIPVLFLYGTEDPISIQLAIQNMEQLVDRVKIVQMPGIGHWVMLEDPQTVTEEVLQWLPDVVPAVGGRL